MKDRKGITISREAWNTLRELQVIFDAETYSETIFAMKDYLEREEKEASELSEKMQGR